MLSWMVELTISTLRCSEKIILCQRTNPKHIYQNLPYDVPLTPHSLILGPLTAKGEKFVDKFSLEQYL